MPICSIHLNNVRPALISVIVECKLLGRKRLLSNLRLPQGCIPHVDQEEANGRMRINCSEICLECLWRKGEEAEPRLLCAPQCA